MSDESSPPVLRLKPRVRLESDANAPQPSVTPLPEAPVVSADPTPAPAPLSEPAGSQPRLRLKPKLAGEEATSQSTPPAAAPQTPVADVPVKPTISLRPPQPAAAVAPATPSAPAGVPAPQPPSVASVSDAPPAASSTEAPLPKLKFNLQRPAPVASPTAPAPETSSSAEAKPRPPPFPVVAPTAPQTTAAPLATPPPPPEKVEVKSLAVPHLRAPQRMLDGEKTKTAPKEKSAPKKASKQFLKAAAVVVLVIGGLAAFRIYRQATRTSVVPPVKTAPTVVKTAPASAPSQPVKPATAGTTPTATPAATNPAPPTLSAKAKLAGDPNPTPSETLNKLAHLPAREIAKAQAVVDAQQARQQERMNELVGSSSTAPAQTTPPRPSTVKPAAPVTATSQVAPGVKATTSVAGASGSASTELRSWAASARLSGLFLGANPRALINGRMVQPGQVVDEPLQIIFDKIEADGKTLVFRDATGATVSRKF